MNDIDVDGCMFGIVATLTALFLVWVVWAVATGNPWPWP